MSDVQTEKFWNKLTRLLGQTAIFKFLGDIGMQNSFTNVRQLSYIRLQCAINNGHTRVEEFF